MLPFPRPIPGRFEVPWSPEILLAMLAFQLNQKVIEQAAQALRAGLLVAFPTETVYGLGADAQSQPALERLFEAKRRPANHPVIVHLAEFSQVLDWCSEVPESAWILASHFWPGPLTMILKRSQKALDQVTGGQDTVAVRVPKHPVALALLATFGDGIAAPSANRFGFVSPTSAQDVRLEFGNEVYSVLEGGSCDVGIESTIVDLTGPQPVILRPGMIASEDIFSVLGGNELESAGKGKGAIRVPGSHKRHYATRTPLQLKKQEELFLLVNGGSDNASNFAILSFADLPQSARGSSKVSRWIRAASNPAEYARSLYRHLRDMDLSGAGTILVEEPPEEPAWFGIRDRLARAAESSEV